MKISSRLLMVLVPVLIFGGIGIGVLTGSWQTESDKTPSRFSTGEYEGQANPVDIRGSYTFDDISRVFGIDTAVLAEAFNVPEQSGDLRLADLEGLYGEIDGYEIGTDAVRLFVARYLGVPYEPESTTGTFAPAVSAIEAAGNADAQQLVDLRSRVVDVPARVAEAGSDSAAFEEVIEEVREEHEEAEAAESYAVRGPTTFGEVVQWGVTVEEIEEVLGMEMGPRTMLIRDFCTENGLQFSAIRERLQILVDAAQG